MGLFSFWKSDAASYFSAIEKEAILAAIKKAEQQTSGEVRVFIENRCKFVDALDRAAEIFFGLKMEETQDRNAVLVYLAMKDRQFAVFADQGIFIALGSEYWNKEASLMVQEFKKESYATGLVTVISDIGKALHQHFPYDYKGDKNELPDDIVFGK
ncbi:TPM domain-containing protein [soil metagenome]